MSGGLAAAAAESLKRGQDNRCGRDGCDVAIRLAGGGRWRAGEHLRPIFLAGIRSHASSVDVCALNAESARNEPALPTVRDGFIKAKDAALIA
jgi:hypothetical protein